MAANKYRAAIVGCGRIASTFDNDPLRKYVASHAGAYKTHPKTELVAACDLDEERLQTFGKRWGINSLYKDFAAMLREERPDIVSICTWPGTHSPLVKETLKHKVRAIFCEKPITDELSQADELVKLCEKAKIVAAVNHSRRWDDGHERIRQFIHKGGLGTIRHVSCYYTAGLLNTATHMFDMLRFFLGEAQWVFAAPKPVLGDKDPTLSGQILFENNVLVSMNGLDVKDYLVYDMDFYGSAGRLKITHSGFETEYWVSDKSPYYSGYRELKPAKIDFKLKKKEMLRNAVADIVTCIDRKKNPRSTMRDGRQSLEIICAFLESHRVNKRVDLPLKKRSLKAHW